MRWRTEYPVLLNLLVALAVSLVVNFSYLLLLLVDPNTPAPPPEEVPAAEEYEAGLLWVSPDGHGYLIGENGDSVYAAMSRIRRLGLADGDSLTVSVSAPASEAAHPVLKKVVRRNG